MVRQRIRVLALFVVVGLALLWQATLAGLWSQVASGTIIGNVRDASGAVVPKATISCKNVDTGVMRDVVTDSLGAYQIPSLPAGTYDVEVSLTGFRTETRRGVGVTVGAASKVDFSLAPGALEQTVEVTATPPQVNTTDASMGGLVGEAAVRELPLNGRDWLQLATLQAGVIGGIGQQSSADLTNSRAARGNGIALSISGHRPTENVFLVDGLVVNDYANASPGSGLNVNLGVDAVREFRVFTNEYTAQYGRSSGGVVTAVYKSGTNSFHGDVFEFMRNSALDARNFFDVQKPGFHRNQFGGSVGGPIRKDKTFFFADAEALREVKGIAQQSITLSLAARQGQLSTGPVKIASSIGPYLAFFPLPNGPTIAPGDTAKYFLSGRLDGNEEYVVGRVDHYFTQNTQLSGSYQFDDTTEAQPDPYNLKLIGSPSRHQNLILNLQHAFTSNMINTARMGFSRTHATDALDTSAANPLATNTSLGFLPGRPAGIITVGGLTPTQGGLGASGADILDYTSFQWNDDASWIKGRNTFSFGGTVERMRYNKNSVATPLGEYDFDSISSFLLGIPGQFTTDIPGAIDIRGIRQTYAGVYFQDAVAVRQNLKVNLGVRYEHVTPLTETFGRVAVLDTLTAAVPRTGGAYYNTNSANFSPRVGIAWDPSGNGKTSIRTGFGLYDVLAFPYVVENRTNGYPSFLIGTIQSPPAIPFPTGATAQISNSGLRATYMEPNPHRAYSMQWNFTVQRQLTASTALTVGYVGSRSNHLARSVDDMDQVPPSLVTVAPDGHLLFPTTGTIRRINPNFGRIAGTTWDGIADYNGLVVDFSKQFSHGFFLRANYAWAKSIDEGSTAFSGNGDNNAVGPAYAFSSTLEKGPSDFDITHHFVLSYTWNIPTSSSFNSATRAVLGGWAVGGIFTAQTGPPFSVTIQTDQARTGNSRVRASDGGQRPNAVASPACSNPVNPGNPSNYIQTQCFTFPALGQLGNLGRNTLRAPGLEDFDFSIFKNWGLWSEKLRLQFRTEIFNLLNHPNFQEPKVKLFDNKGSVLTNAGILGAPTLTSERQIQFGLKLTW
jgi:hypothetical protein